MKHVFLMLLVVTQVPHLAAAELSVNVLTVNGTPAADVVVYATPNSGLQGLPINQNQLVIDQQDRMFSPYVTVMQTGQVINFSNKDDITHHIYSVSGENRFDFKLQAGQKMATQVINASEEIAMGCNIHDWMSGFVLAVNTPYFAKTNAQGNVTLSLQTQGEYTVSVWHPQLNTSDHTVTVPTTVSKEKNALVIELDKALLPIPAQVSQEEFDFLEEY